MAWTEESYTLLIRCYVCWLTCAVFALRGCHFSLVNCHCTIAVSVLTHHHELVLRPFDVAVSRQWSYSTYAGGPGPKHHIISMRIEECKCSSTSSEPLHWFCDLVVLTLGKDRSAHLDNACVVSARVLDI